MKIRYDYYTGAALSRVGGALGLVYAARLWFACAEWQWKRGTRKWISCDLVPSPSHAQNRLQSHPERFFDLLPSSRDLSRVFTLRDVCILLSFFFLLFHFFSQSSRFSWDDAKDRRCLSGEVERISYIVSGLAEISSSCDLGSIIHEEHSARKYSRESSRRYSIPSTCLFRRCLEATSVMSCSTFFITPRRKHNCIADKIVLSR